ncbi:MAG: hypothetical protein PHO15_04520 [Eubacteriales bacterium]|nr:hypothetical protein [Eubacteriales bacterium]
MEPLGKILLRAGKERLLTIFKNTNIDASEHQPDSNKELVDTLCIKIPAKWREIVSYFNSVLAKEFEAISIYAGKHSSKMIDMTDVFSGSKIALKWEDIFLSFGMGFELENNIKEVGEKRVFSMKMVIPGETAELLGGYKEYLCPDRYALFDNLQYLNKKYIDRFGKINIINMYNLINKKIQISRDEYFAFTLYAGIFDSQNPHLERGMLYHYLIDTNGYFLKK